MRLTRELSTLICTGIIIFILSPGLAACGSGGSRITGIFPENTNVASPGGWPNQTNTGYENAPGYPGHLTDCSSITPRSNTIYKYCDFPDGLSVGNSDRSLTSVTFIGCRFADSSIDWADVKVYGNNIAFVYDTFEPKSAPSASEPIRPTAALANSAGIARGIQQMSPGAIMVSHSDVWGFGAGLQFYYSTRAHPVTVSDTWVHNPRYPGTGPGSDHTDGILDASANGVSYMTIHHDSIIGDGRTQGLALQANTYDHLTITDNYFSGYGYMLDIGTKGVSTNIIFTGNVWGSDIEPYWGPIYNDASFVTSGLGNIWSDNVYHVVPGTSWLNSGNNSLYWWPTDFCAAGQGSCGPHSIIGHTTDYVIPKR